MPLRWVIKDILVITNNYERVVAAPSEPRSKPALALYLFRAHAPANNSSYITHDGKTFVARLLALSLLYGWPFTSTPHDFCCASPSASARLCPPHLPPMISQDGGFCCLSQMWLTAWDSCRWHFQRPRARSQLYRGGGYVYSTSGAVTRQEWFMASDS